jgi:NAD-dependent deacetylase
MHERAHSLLADAAAEAGRLVVLTGAGISAESGIPTFRGKEGYWTVGSSVYHPQQMATRAAFERMPDEVWRWYLYRRTVCRGAAPNPAHLALVRLEEALGDRVRLITQNVDGLHLRAGNSLARTYQIHGNIDYARCAGTCPLPPWPIPEALGAAAGDGAPAEDEVALLRCPDCGGRARPHVLWFDECYDEPLFRFESSLRAASEAALLILVGTSASTTLPWHVVEIAAQRGAVVIDVNTDDNPFGELAASLPTGCALRAAAAATVPALVETLLDEVSE